MESAISTETQVFIDALHLREAQLIEYVRQERDFRLKALREQVSSCTCKLQHTTGLLQFCIEALKETDPTAFLQVSIGTLEMSWLTTMTQYKY